MTIEEYDVVNEAMENAGEGLWPHAPVGAGNAECPLPFFLRMCRRRRVPPAMLPSCVFAAAAARVHADPTHVFPPHDPPFFPDRFYRLTAVGVNSSPAEAQRAADAFRAVALTWMARNQVGGHGRAPAAGGYSRAHAVGGYGRAPAAGFG